MKTRITNQTIILHRDGKRVKVGPGKQIELTDEELADLKRNAPDAVRTPRNEAELTPKVDIPAGNNRGNKTGRNASEEL